MKPMVLLFVFLISFAIIAVSAFALSWAVPVLVATPGYAPAWVVIIGVIYLVALLVRGNFKS